jgi:hypothetical protein
MAANAKVTWMVCQEPWKVEGELIVTRDLPLNLDQNRIHGFHPILTELRRACKTKARELPILPR